MGLRRGAQELEYGGYQPSYGDGPYVTEQREFNEFVSAGLSLRYCNTFAESLVDCSQIRSLSIF